MEFCPTCDALLIVTKNEDKTVLVCRDCGYQSDDPELTKSYIITENIAHSEKEVIELIEEKEQVDGISEDMREELTEQFRESIESFEF